MVSAGTNFLTQYEDRLAQAIAACPTFGAWVAPGVASDHVHIYDIPGPSTGLIYGEAQWNDLHPHACILYPDGGENGEARHDATIQGFSAGYNYWILFQKLLELDLNSNNGEEIRRLTNPVGSVMAELQTVSRNFNLGLDTMGPVNAPGIPDYRMGDGDDAVPVCMWIWGITYNLS